MGRVDENATELVKLDVGNNKSSKYKVKKICDNAVYTRNSMGYLSELYYLIF